MSITEAIAFAFFMLCQCAMWSWAFYLAKKRRKQ